MKKVIVTALVGVFLVGGIVLAKGAAKSVTPEGKACMKMAELCGDESSAAKDFDQCVDRMNQARKVAGDASFEKSASCVAESNSCAAATGCWMGGVGVGALGEMMKGFGSALSK